MGMWSKPAELHENQLFQARTELVPSLAQLASRVKGVSVEAKKVDVKKKDETRAPLEAHVRPCYATAEAHWSPTNPQFYAIGNTFGYNVAAGVHDAHDDAVTVLLAACGDIRNILATVHSCKPSLSFVFTMNDGNKSMLARNLVLLHMIAEGKATDEDVLAVWANHFVTPRVKSGPLTAALTALCTRPSELSWLSLDVALQEIVDAWLTADQSISKEMLKSLRDSQTAHLMGSAKALSEQAAGGQRLSKKIKEAISTYIDAGCLPAPQSEANTAVNPTFLLAPALQYTVYFSSSIFRAVPLASDEKTAVGGLLKTLAPQLASLRAAIQEKRVLFKVVPGDVISTMQGASARNEAFDFIDTSNVSDYVSVLGLLYASSLTLKRNSWSRVMAESIVAVAGALAQKPPPSSEEIVSHCFVNKVFQDLLAAMSGLTLVSTANLSNGGTGIRTMWRCDAQTAMPPGRLLLDAASALIAASASKARFSKQQLGYPPSFAAVAGLIYNYAADREALLDALVEKFRVAQQHTWELDLVRGKHQELSLVSFTAQVGIRLIQYSENPLILTFSKKELSPGHPVAFEGCQIMTQIAWDTEMGVASFLMDTTQLNAIAAWFGTVCCLTATGALAVGESRAVGTMQRRPVGSEGIATKVVANAKQPTSSLALLGKLPLKMGSDFIWTFCPPSVDILLPAPMSAKPSIMESDGGLTVHVGDQAHWVPWPNGKRPLGKRVNRVSRDVGLLSVMFADSPSCVQ
eukprot:TRINITY_DN35243_c0_g1_i2.p1 TRINITY_DN35243_c0_g1~~TRINITY_DN35243_c0_g1_i2.p1  ORF type:complete len:747 (+),score=141.33 TRINITY_DN35243_c0_g1_i2:396-2636(+)